MFYFKYRETSDQPSKTTSALLFYGSNELELSHDLARMIQSNCEAAWKKNDITVYTIISYIQQTNAIASVRKIRPKWQNLKTFSTDGCLILISVVALIEIFGHCTLQIMKESLAHYVNHIMVCIHNQNRMEQKTKCHINPRQSSHFIKANRRGYNALHISRKRHLKQ